MGFEYRKFIDISFIPRGPTNVVAGLCHEPAPVFIDGALCFKDVEIVDEHDVGGEFPLPTHHVNPFNLNRTLSCGSTLTASSKQQPR